MSDRLMRLREVAEMTSLGKTTIYRRMEAGTFPRPQALGPACVRWRQSAILQWMSELEETARRAA